MEDQKGIAKLPQELLDEIDAEHLDAASRIALRLTCKSLHTNLSNITINKQLCNVNPCYYRLVSSHTDTQSGRRRCALCGQRYPFELFTDCSSAADREYLLRHGCDRGTGGPGMIPTASDICDWERSRFVALLNPATSLQYISRSHMEGQTTLLGPNCRWITQLQRMCMHCHQFLDLWRQSCCSCQFCGIRNVQVFVRLVGPDWEGRDPERYVIVRDVDGGHYSVKEWHQDGHVEYFTVDEV
jgi:hypothetical protein